MIQFKVGNIIDEQCDCIVNSTNAELAWEETTLNGDILNAGGLGLINHLIRYHKYHGDLKVGHTIITPGYELNAKYVLHTYCPVWEGGNYNEIELMQWCYKSIFNLADVYNIKTLSIPSIGTGVFNWPIKLSAYLGIEEAKLNNNIDTTFVLYTTEIKQLYESVLE